VKNEDCYFQESLRPLFEHCLEEQ